jgi:hypothetical protein
VKFLLRLIVFYFLALVGVARSEEMLFTTPGKYATRDGQTTLDLTLAPPDLTILIGFKCKKISERTGQEVTSSRTMTLILPLTPGKWVFCFGPESEIWFYDGSSYSCFWNTPEKMRTLSTCSDSTLGERAPGPMKQWVRRLEASKTK